MVMHDALDETLVGRIPTAAGFRQRVRQRVRQRFGKPYAVIHRADVHSSLLDAVLATDRIQVLRRHDNDFAQAFAWYQHWRVARTARIVWWAREMGRILHAKGVERLVRNELWRGRTPERFYAAMEWLYGWRVDNCLAT
jgi:2-polyprenyl-6-methoxyphenol hydroxylase-like FAD-dependent oxidoreductase